MSSSEVARTLADLADDLETEELAGFAPVLVALKLRNLATALRG